MADQEASSPQLESSEHDVSLGFEDGSDDEMDWEEIAVPPLSSALRETDTMSNGVANGPDQASTSSALAQAAKTGNIEITLKRVKGKGKVKDEARKKRAEEITQLRALRLICHKIHTVCLLSSAIIRNRWLNDPLLHARLLSLLPMKYQTSFQMITKKQYPDVAKRGRLFETAVMRSTQWWYETFEVLDYGHIRSRTFEQVQRLLSGEDKLDDEGEVIRSTKSLMKRALFAQGSRDVSAQLFTALCRALDIPARLVVSLQSVPWQANVGKPKTASKKRWEKRREGRERPKGNVPNASDSDSSNEDDNDDDMEEVSIPTPSVDRKGKGKAVFPGEGSTLSGTGKPSAKGKKARSKPVRLRQSKSMGRRLGSTSSSRYDTPPPPSAPPIGGPFPVYWTEVFSKPDGKWMPIDPVRYIVNKRRVFEPPASDGTNRMVYVVAVEEDGYCRDVTPRYAKDYAAKTSKAQLGGKGRREWWEGVMALVTRPYRLNRDDIEDMEFETNQYREGMPTSVTGFKDHPIYFLKQHLKRDEVIHPEVELGKFRGEPVYPRANVIQLKTTENWMRQGRRVKEGEQAMKWVRQRAMTIHRRRAMELAQQEGDEMLQGLYSEAQTEIYVPDPIIDGIVPKNEFGNIDLYTPSMLPVGAVHIPYKGVAKIARKLGFDYAEAVTSFEFKKGRAFPVISGIVVAAENEQAILEAYWETERDAEEKERKKRMDRVLKRWTKLIQGLRLRQRLQEQYGGNGPGESSTSVQQKTEQETPSEPVVAGGFLSEADTVVQPFHLPRFEHGEYHPALNESGTGAEQDELVGKVMNREEPSYLGPVLPFGSQRIGEPEDSKQDEDEDLDLEEIVPAVRPYMIRDTEGVPSSNAVPKSMLQLAVEAESKREEKDRSLFVEVTPPASNGILATQGRVQSPRGTDNLVAAKVNAPNLSKPKTRKGRRKLTKVDESEEAEADEDTDVDDLDNGWANDGRDDSEDDKDSGRHRQRGEKSTSSPLKRKRKEPVPVTPAPSTRVLRPRAPKSAEKIKAEKEAEEAYRNAIAE